MWCCLVTRSKRLRPPLFQLTVGLFTNSWSATIINDKNSYKLIMEVNSVSLLEYTYNSIRYNLQVWSYKHDLKHCKVLLSQLWRFSPHSSTTSGDVCIWVRLSILITWWRDDINIIQVHVNIIQIWRLNTWIKCAASEPVDVLRRTGHGVGRWPHSHQMSQKSEFSFQFKNRQLRTWKIWVPSSNAAEASTGLPPTQSCSLTSSCSPGGWEHAHPRLSATSCWLHTNVIDIYSWFTESFCVISFGYND